MGVARLYKVGSPYNGVELAELDYEQSADVMYLAHIDHVLTKLLRSGHTDWEFVSVTFGPGISAPIGVNAVATSPNDGDGTSNGGGTNPNFWDIEQSYVVTAVSAETGQQSRASTADSCTNDLTLPGNFNTITWTAVTGADRYFIYKSEEQSGSYGYIGTATTTSFVDNNIAPDMSDTPPLARNPFDGADNYPSAVTFFEQRLMLGRTRNQPNGVWGSQSANFENFDVSRPLKADDALSFALLSRRVNAANHLVATDKLLALSSDAIFVVTGANDDYLSAAVPPRARPQLGRGSARLKPIIADGTVFYRPSVGSSVRSIGFTFEIDGYRSDDVSIFSPHLFEGHSILWWAHAQEPLSVIWMGRDDGKLLCFTWEAEQQVWGFTVCETDGIPLSGCVITEDGEDRLYMVVEREIAGTTKRFIERMAAVLWQDQSESCYLDCARSFEFETPTATIPQLWHLEGATVTALADGNVYEDLVVTGGQVVLPDEVSAATVGLPFVAIVETLTPSVVASGKRQSPKNGFVRLHESRGVEIGSSEARLVPIKDRTSEAYGDPTNLRSGVFESKLAPVWSNECTVMLRQRLPLPFTLLGVYYDVDTHG